MLQKSPSALLDIDVENWQKKFRQAIDFILQCNKARSLKNRLQPDKTEVI